MFRMFQGSAYFRLRLHVSFDSIEFDQCNWNDLYAIAGLPSFRQKRRYLPYVKHKDIEQRLVQDFKPFLARHRQLHSSIDKVSFSLYSTICEIFRYEYPLHVIHCFWKAAVPDIRIQCIGSSILDPISGYLDQRNRDSSDQPVATPMAYPGWSNYKGGYGGRGKGGWGRGYRAWHQNYMPVA